MAFIFQSAKEKETIQRGKWYWDNSISSLKEWMPLLYPIRERVDIQPL
jgi:hypothetical protein